MDRKVPQTIRSASILALIEIAEQIAYQAILFTGAAQAHPDGDPKAPIEVTGTVGELLEVLAAQQAEAA